MKGRVLKFSRMQSTREAVWCEPLGLCFPHIYRVERQRIPSLSRSLPPASISASVTPKFFLGDIADGSDGLANAAPVDHLSSSDDTSLVVRHHWSRALACAYLQGVEDVGPCHGSSGIYEKGDAAFTIMQCVTRGTWSGPMIFYLAERFDDCSPLGVEIWEQSVGTDGRLQQTDIFYG